MITVCCSNICERRSECANHGMNNDGMNYAEDFYNFGYASISNEKYEETWACSELGNWGMFEPIDKINIEVDIPFPWQYLNRFINGEIKFETAVDMTIDECYRLIEEYVRKHGGTK